MTVISASQWGRESLKKAGSLKMESPQTVALNDVIRLKPLGLQVCGIY
jgi:hypothetical protein